MDEIAVGGIQKSAKNSRFSGSGIWKCVNVWRVARGRCICLRIFNDPLSGRSGRRHVCKGRGAKSIRATIRLTNLERTGAVRPPACGRSQMDYGTERRRWFQSVPQFGLLPFGFGFRCGFGDDYIYWSGYLRSEGGGGRGWSQLIRRRCRLAGLAAPAAGFDR